MCTLGTTSFIAVQAGSLTSNVPDMQAEQGEFHRQQAERHRASCAQLQADLRDAKTARHEAEHQLLEQQRSLGSTETNAQLRSLVSTLHQEVRSWSGLRIAAAEHGGQGSAVSLPWLSPAESLVKLCNAARTVQAAPAVLWRAGDWPQNTVRQGQGAGRGRQAAAC